MSINPRRCVHMALYFGKTARLCPRSAIVKPRNDFGIGIGKEKTTNFVLILLVVVVFSPNFALCIGIVIGFEVMRPNNFAICTEPKNHKTYALGVFALKNHVASSGNFGKEIGELIRLMRVLHRQTPLHINDYHLSLQSPEAYQGFPLETSPFL